MFLRVFVTHHKTGHHLCNRLARGFSDELSLKYYDLSTASEVPDDADVVVYESSGACNSDSSREYMFASWGGDLKIQNLEFKGIHVVRHPFEIICSAYRWHLKAEGGFTEEWNGTGKSYREHLQTGDGIAFEMNNVSKGVIMNIYNFPFSDPRFLNIKLESFNNDFDATVMRIAEHLDLPTRLLQTFSAELDLNRMSEFPRYVTRTEIHSPTHKELFEPHHYDLFAEIFPSDLLSRLGYDDAG